MIVRTLISDLLGKLNEREFEILFRNLLRSLGHIPIFERTRHGRGEHGKDIISLTKKNKEQEIHVFQIKTRDIPTRRFRGEVKPELDAMIQVPVQHPMIKGSELITYSLVSTGDLSPDAAEEFEAYNRNNAKLGNPEIHLWNRPELVRLFSENMESLPFFTPSFHDNFAGVWLSLRSGKYDRTDWFDVASEFLSSGKQIDSRFLLSLGLATSFLASEARVKNEFFVAFDVFRISLVKMWATICQGKGKNMTIFDQLHEEYCALIGDFVEAISVELSKKEGLFRENNGVIESILYPIRTFSVLGTLSYLAYYRGETGDKKKENQLVEKIEAVIRNNPSALTPPIDSLVKDIAITVRELLRCQRKEFAEKWIELLLRSIYQRYIRSGWSPSESNKPEDIIEDTFHFGGQSMKEHPQSFLIPVLFRFCAKLGTQRVYDIYRASFEDTFRLLEFVPPDDTVLAEAELIQGVLEHGTTIERKFPRDFKECCEQVCQITPRKYTPIKKRRPYILQVITDVHSHYVFPEIYLNNDKC